MGNGVMSHLLCKVLVDHSIRTHVPMAHVIINMTGKVLLKKKMFQTYSRFTNQKINLSRIKIHPQKKILTRWLWKAFGFARICNQGIERNFPLMTCFWIRHSATHKIWKGIPLGQYSGRIKRQLTLGMNTIIKCYNERRRDITHIVLPL